MTEPPNTRLEVVASDWPHGLRCADCSRKLSEGDNYSQRLEGMVDELPVVLIVCGECALAGLT